MTMQDQTIDVGELRGLSDTLFRRLEDRGIRQIRVKNALYWTISPDAAFNMDQPPEPIVGEVFDDMGGVRSEAATAHGEPVSLWHAFHHLAGLMTLIANADLHDGLVAAPAEGSVS